MTRKRTLSRTRNGRISAKSGPIALPRLSGLSVGLSEFFIGVVVVAIVGNAAEHWVAVLVARKDKMDLSVNIAIGSSGQVALFVAPFLVIASYFVGPYPMALVFNGFELGAIVIAILIANYVIQDGESTWFEGVQLLAVYLVFGLAIYFA